MSAILREDFSSIQELGSFLKYLNENDSAYEKYLSHKTEGRISNPGLIQAMEERTWNIDETGSLFFGAFECFLCERLHQDAEKFAWKPLPLSHLGCPPPLSSISLQENLENFWTQAWHHGAVEARVFQQLLSQYPNGISSQVYQDQVLEALNKN